MKTKSDILNREFDITITHTGLRMKDTWMADTWSVEIEGESFSYSTGIGHREKKKQVFCSESPETIRRAMNNNLKDKKYQLLIVGHVSKVVTPKLDDILYCLVNDAQTADMTLDDMFSALDFTKPSEALQCQLACQETRKKLQQIGINIDSAVEAFQNY